MSSIYTSRPVTIYEPIPSDELYILQRCQYTIDQNTYCRPIWGMKVDLQKLAHIYDRSIQYPSLRPAFCTFFDGQKPDLDIASRAIASLRSRLTTPRKIDLGDLLTASMLAFQAGENDKLKSFSIHAMGCARIAQHLYSSLIWKPFSYTERTLHLEPVELQALVVRFLHFEKSTLEGVLQHFDTGAYGDPHELCRSRNGIEKTLQYRFNLKEGDFVKDEEILHCDETSLYSLSVTMHNHNSKLIYTSLSQRAHMSQFLRQFIQSPLRADFSNFSEM